jgi:hypothetical protein
MMLHCRIIVLRHAMNCRCATCYERSPLHDAYYKAEEAESRRAADCPTEEVNVVDGASGGQTRKRRQARRARRSLKVF